MSDRSYGYQIRSQRCELNQMDDTKPARNDMRAPIKRNPNSSDTVELTMLLKAMARKTTIAIVPLPTGARECQRPEPSHLRAPNHATAKATAYTTATERAPTKYNVTAAHRAASTPMTSRVIPSLLLVTG